MSDQPTAPQPPPPAQSEGPFSYKGGVCRNTEWPYWIVGRTEQSGWVVGEASITGDFCGPCEEVRKAEQRCESLNAAYASGLAAGAERGGRVEKVVEAARAYVGQNGTPPQDKHGPECTYCNLKRAVAALLPPPPQGKR